MSARRAVPDRLDERVERLCGGTLEERALRVALIEELHGGVGFDWYAWLLTDPVTEVGASPLAEIPSLPDLPRLIRSKYLTTLNRWTTMDAAAVGLHAATGGALERSLLWEEVLSGYGVVDVASLVFRDGQGLWGWLDLWRTAPAGPFDAEEISALAGVVAPVTLALRRAVARTIHEQPPIVARSGPAVLVLSGDLQVRAQTPVTEDYLRELVPPEGDRRPIPAGAYNVAAQLLAVEAGVDDHPPLTRVHLDSGVWLTLRAARVDAVGPPSDRDIAVTIEATSPAERRRLFVASHGLSPRERELVELLAHGADTHTIAEQMFLSEHTVQDHLKSVFAKTGTRNRRSLLARLVGG